jgi:hypothetical protein
MRSCISKILLFLLGFYIFVPRDLAREQLARKKLHNEMEDLKGKIRVYVRIRPFSYSERERGCQEAVIKVNYLLFS